MKPRPITRTDSLQVLRQDLESLLQVQTRLPN